MRLLSTRTMQTTSTIVEDGDKHNNNAREFGKQENNVRVLSTRTMQMRVQTTSTMVEDGDKHNNNVCEFGKQENNAN